jgi:hypothetical protein
MTRKSVWEFCHAPSYQLVSCHHQSSSASNWIAQEAIYGPDMHVWQLPLINQAVHHPPTSPCHHHAFAPLSGQSAPQRPGHPDLVLCRSGMKPSRLRLRDAFAAYRCSARRAGHSGHRWASAAESGVNAGCLGEPSQHPTKLTCTHTGYTWSHTHTHLPASTLPREGREPSCNPSLMEPYRSV